MKYVTFYNSPVGRITVGTSGGRLKVCDWVDTNPRHKLIMRRFLQGESPLNRADDPFTASIITNLDEFFSGERRIFTLDIAPDGTEFQKSVWRALSEVPYGDTISYKELAAAIGYDSGVRAVANAVAANPLSIIVPCHRIIGSDGTLTGYAGGLSAKRQLLLLEHHFVDFKGI